MRQRLGPKALARYSRLANLLFVRGLVRGNTEHRVDLWTAEGACYIHFKGEGFEREMPNDLDAERIEALLRANP